MGIKYNLLGWDKHRDFRIQG